MFQTDVEHRRHWNFSATARMGTHVKNHVIPAFAGMTAVAISPHAIHATDHVGTGAHPTSLATAPAPAPLSATDLAARFTGKGPWKKRLPQIIDTLEALGRVRRQGDGVSAIG